MSNDPISTDVSTETTRARGVGRRGFLQVSAAAGGGLLLGFSLFGCGKKSKETPEKSARATPETPGERTESEINAWLRIASDGSVTVIVSESEMGQGVLTSLPMILADELEADWSKVSSEHADADPRYGHQSTGGSTSIRGGGFEQMRRVGAAAREMLIAAAAATWDVPAGEIARSLRARQGSVEHVDGRKLGYGQLAARAATIEPPAEPRLKDPKEFRLIGKPLPRLDTRGKIDGSVTYGLDVKVPGMVIASVEHCPIFGGTAASFDASEAKKVPGVLDVIEIPTGVAVVGEHFWACQKGREALKVTWTGGELALDSRTLLARAKKVIASGKVAREEGNIGAALGKGTRRVKAEYTVPYLAHTPMEPLNCTVKLDDDRCEVWVPTQSPTRAVELVAKLTGLSPEAITLHRTMLGGGFGRRSQADFVADATHVAKAVGKPVKVVWTREDDVRGGHYRPMAYNQLEAALDDEGWPIAWRHRIASPSILKAFGPLENGIDATSVEGAANLPYAIPNLHVTFADVPSPVSVWFWRSVGSSQNAYVTEHFLDEVARAGGKDPLALRQRLLADAPRHKRVLDAAALKAGWGSPLPAGRARGIAVHESFGSIVAQVAEVSLENGVPRVHKVVCAVDCGQQINPNTIAAQMESGIIYGLSAALYGQIELAGGRAVQSNFHDYPAVRMDEAPEIETVFVPSGDPHGGIGEPGTPPIAPAVCNAILALTGEPVRTLPIVRAKPA